MSAPRTDPEAMSFADAVAILAPWAKDHDDVDAVVRLVGEVASSLGIGADAAIMPELRAHNSALVQFDAWLLAEKDETAKLAADLAAARAETEAALVQVSLADLAACRGALDLATAELDSAKRAASALASRVDITARRLDAALVERDAARRERDTHIDGELEEARRRVELTAENTALRARIDGVLSDLSRMDALLACDIDRMSARRSHLARLSSWVAEKAPQAPAEAPRDGYELSRAAGALRAIREAATEGVERIEAYREHVAQEAGK